MNRALVAKKVLQYLAHAEGICLSGGGKYGHKRIRSMAKKRTIQVGDDEADEGGHCENDNNTRYNHIRFSFFIFIIYCINIISFFL